MEFENIIYIVKDGVATIQLNRPKAYNALNSAINKDIMDALRLIQSEGGIRAVVITGSAKAFAAGADISEMRNTGPNDARKVSAVAIEINNLLESLPVPTIAAVSGLAWGGGFELALACDFRIGGPKTSFKLPEVSLGIIPGAHGTQRLLALVGQAKAKEVVMLCREIRGEEALGLGLLTQMVPDDEVLDAAYRLADELKAMPGMSLTAAKSAIRTGTLGTIADGKQAESAEFCLLFDTYDQKEGMTAFAEKRPPDYRNC